MQYYLFYFPIRTNISVGIPPRYCAKPLVELKDTEFIRRFALHILPSGFVRILLAAAHFIYRECRIYHIF